MNLASGGVFSILLKFVIQRRSTRLLHPKQGGVLRLVVIG